MINKPNKNKTRQKVHLRIRKNIKGTVECPRLNVYRSTSHIYGQLIDDVAGNTLLSLSSLDKGISKLINGKTKTEQASIVGEKLGEKAVAAGYTKVVYDRGGYIYTGRVAAFAEGARKAGLIF
ncbi:MAG: 50S ribosomal protein L18 [Clostridiales bacterium]|jgi:large subunit ribosomal protein L18|nr:50S ribosomal protein L18 [Clostridiales bacterium]